jgi:Fe(3+) dicitrate transport protein
MLMPVFQSLMAKVQYSEDLANETYLGLTDADYANNAYRRYVGSNEDYIVSTTNHVNALS